MAAPHGAEDELMVTSYRKALETNSDIQQHLGLLHGLACQSEVIVELGFRTGISTAALCASGKPVFSYDIEDCEPHVSRLKKEYPNLTFIKGDSRKIRIPGCTMLFIDTEHTYDCLSTELHRHACDVSMWIVMHDTEKFCKKDKHGKGPGMLQAIEEFLDASFYKSCYRWQMILHLPNCNGLTILERNPVLKRNPTLERLP